MKQLKIKEQIREEYLLINENAIKEHKKIYISKYNENQFLFYTIKNNHLHHLGRLIKVDNYFKTAIELLKQYNINYDSEIYKFECI